MRGGGGGRERGRPREEAFDEVLSRGAEGEGERWEEAVVGVGLATGRCREYERDLPMGSRSKETLLGGLGGGTEASKASLRLGGWSLGRRRMGASGISLVWSRLGLSCSLYSLVLLCIADCSSN